MIAVIVHSSAWPEYRQLVLKTQEPRAQFWQPRGFILTKWLYNMPKDSGIANKQAKLGAAVGVIQVPGESTAAMIFREMEDGPLGILLDAASRLDASPEQQVRAFRHAAKTRILEPLLEQRKILVAREQAEADAAALEAKRVGGPSKVSSLIPELY